MTKQRKTKFRAWHHEFKKMGVVGGMKIEQDGVFVLLSNVRLPYHGIFGFKVGETVELMQFTGLIDINGVDIYEGDIVRGRPHGWSVDMVGVVEWRNDGWWLSDETERDLEKRLYEHFLWGVEVIGNIYENPEILEGEA